MNTPKDNFNKVVICQDDTGEEMERIAYFEDDAWYFRNDNLEEFNEPVRWCSFPISLV